MQENLNMNLKGVNTIEEGDEEEEGEVYLYLSLPQNGEVNTTFNVTVCLILSLLLVTGKIGQRPKTLGEVHTLLIYVYLCFNS